MRIEIAKRTDDSGVLSCQRADGSQTWQKQKSNAAPHFALHDLTHYAVETALGYGSGFFGLIAQGWEISDTTGKGSRGRLPPEALEVEQIVGLFDMERASGTLMTAADFTDSSPRRLTEEEIQAVRKLRASVFAGWKAVPAGEKLRLTF